MYKSKLLSLFIFLFASFATHAQVVSHVHWTFNCEKTGESEFLFIAKATMDKGWHIFPQKVTDEYSVRTEFTFNASKDYQLIGEPEEKGSIITHNIPDLNLVQKYYENRVFFRQKIHLKSGHALVSGTVKCQTCNDAQCTLPPDANFNIKVGEGESDKSISTESKTPKSDTDKTKLLSQSATVDTPASKTDSSQAQLVSAFADDDDKNAPPDDLDKKSLWEVILAGVGAGLISLLMPCVWPIIPLTVSFFLKQSKDKPAKGRSNAIIYGISIMLIFVVLGVLVSLLTNGQELNALSTNWFFNLLFFAVFVLFGVSFMGYFEITLPSSFINKSEQLSEKGGAIGIFFMAFTLVLVSFSCTLPFIGSLIQFVADKKGFLKPVLGFMAYGFTLGLPFGLFAYFPSALHKLPKSGGWMNSIKVNFGMLEIAFAFIYLSKVDMAYHWGFLSKEKFLVIWMAITFILGLYNIGKLRFPHDDAEKGSIGWPAAFISIIFFSLTFYFSTGFSGNQLEFYSGFIPNYSEIRKDANDHKYGDIMEAPLNLDLYFDYKEALAASKKYHKPLFIDFTGHGCVNCRKMEKTVWPNSDVLKRFKNNFIMVSLYVDDKTTLPEKDQYMSTALNKKVTTLGDMNYDIEVSKYQLGAQPYYVITDNEGKALLRPKGSVFEVKKYINYLDKGIYLYKEKAEQKDKS